MAVSERFVSFDVDAIADYVFAAAGPTEVMGASALIERFDERAGALGAAHGGTVVFVGGGSGLVRLPAERVAAFHQALVGKLAELTAGAATCTVIDVAAEGPFRSCWEALAAGMARAKRERALRHTLAVRVPAGTPPGQVCWSCGREPGDAGVRHEHRIGAECQARVSAATDQVELDDRQVRVTRELERVEAAGERRGGLAATIYLDADDLGLRIRQIDSADALGAFARSLRTAVQAAVADTVIDLGLDNQVVLPVVGGDDVVMIGPAARTLEVLKALWTNLDANVASLAAGTEPLRFSAGVAIAPVRAPLRVQFDLARRALKAAKLHAKASAAAGERSAYLQVRSIAPLARHATDVPLFGAALPRNALEALLEVLARVRKTSRAQIAGLRRDLDDPVGPLRRLHLDYRASRDEAVAGLLRAAQEAAGTAGVDAEALLTGALDLEPVVGVV